MKKIFTLIAVAAMAMSVNAQTWKAADEAPAAGATLVDNDLVTIKTVYGTNYGADARTINDESFTGWIQLRVASDPTADEPNGGEQSGSTSIVVTAKQNIKIKVYVRRQKGSDGYNAGDNKDLLCFSHAAGAKVDGTFTLDSNEDASGSYGHGTNTFELAAGSYTLYRKGSTMRIFGIAYEANGSSNINVVKAEETNAPAYNLAGQKVAEGYKGIVIKNGKKVIK